MSVPLMLTCFLVACSLVVVNAFGLRHHYALRGPVDIPAGAADPSWFQQKLDHFNPQEQRTWPQKYFLNSTFYKSGGPVFFLLGGEGPLSPSSVAGNHFILTQYAQQYNAIVVSLEHRFYGDSVPLNDSSTPNLRYLTTLQALADFANFRSSLPSQPGMQFLPFNATWIVFGGSYSGSLSAWARLKYPHLFHGSLAASAPVHAQTDFPEYFDVVTSSIGPSCASAMAAGTVAVENMLNSASGRDRLQRYFNTCTPIVTDDDAATFMGNLASVVSGVVQYNRDNNNYMPEDLETMCSTFLSITDTVQAWVNLTQLFSGGVCMEVSYDQTIKDLQPSSAGRSWTYQTCTEYGYFQTGELEKQPFSKRITLDYFLRTCKDAFGVALTPDTKWIEEAFGGRGIVTSNTFFSNGNVDPWHALGIIQPFTPPMPNSDVFFIDGTAHCADLYPPSPKDVPGLTSARKRFVELLESWLSSQY